MVIRSNVALRWRSYDVTQQTSPNYIIKEQSCLGLFSMSSHLIIYQPKHAFAVHFVDREVMMLYPGDQTLFISLAPCSTWLVTQWRNSPNKYSGRGQSHARFRSY